jgi:hypothetical protein
MIEVLERRITDLTNAVIADWRWVRDDLSVSVLGMILYGYTLETGQALGATTPDVDAAMLRCMTLNVGAASKWSGGLVAEASAAARDQFHHPGHHELIGVGRTYHTTTDQRALVDNVYANIASVRKRAGLPEPKVPVFLNPLVMLLAARERQKGQPLTEAEVIEVRDGAVCSLMTLSQAERFYTELDARAPVLRLDPERLWEQWQAVRDRLT